MIIQWSDTVSMADDKTEEWAAYIAMSQPNIVMVGTGCMLGALRVQVRRGKINAETVAIHYKDRVIYVDKYGTLSEWPEGLADVSIRQHLELLGMNDELEPDKEDSEDAQRLRQDEPG